MLQDLILKFSKAPWVTKRTATDSMKHISAKPSALAEGNNVITENKIARHK